MVNKTSYKSHLFNTLKIVLIIIQAFFVRIAGLPAQQVSELADIKSLYELLLTRFKIYQDYFEVDSEIRQLYQQALDLAEQGQYDIAAIILEEALTMLKEHPDRRSDQTAMQVGKHSETEKNSENFIVALIGGLDYNRQEFEIGYFESDSTVREELNKPFIGLSLGYQTLDKNLIQFEIKNSLRFDKENMRNDYRFRWQPRTDFYLQYNGYWNQAIDENSYSYWDQIVSAKLDLELSEVFNWNLFNTYNYKIYRSGSLTLHDYYRNRLQSLLQWQAFTDNMLSLEYGYELNEVLGYQDYDYQQHHIRTSWHNQNFETVQYHTAIEGALRDYTLNLNDSLIENRYRALTVDVNFEFAITKKFRLVLENSLLYKTYQQKSALEPDYYWDYLRPGLTLMLWQSMELGIGYELELKEHQALIADDYDVSEQNYHSNGLFLSLNYFAYSGMYINSTLSYQWRRYPQSYTSDFISLYSDRNILSAMMLLYLPLTAGLSVNVFVNFDNDLDIDYDQQDNQSIIFNAEFEYRF